MSVRGFLRIEDAKGTREEVLPESPLGAGELPESCWASPDGVIYAVGKLYTGKPGPDEGVVWRRAVDGTWSIAFRLKDRTFRTIVGRGAADIVVGAEEGYVAFDGTSWKVHDLPHSRILVWERGGRLWAQDWDKTTTFELVSGAAKPTSSADRPEVDDPYACRRGETRFRVFDKSEEREQRELSPEEQREIDDELRQLEQDLKDGKTQPRKL